MSLHPSIALLITSQLLTCLAWFWVERDWDRVSPLASLLTFIAAFNLLLILIYRADFEPGAPP